MAGKKTMNLTTRNSSVGLDEVGERYRWNHAILVQAAYQALVCGAICLQAACKPLASRLLTEHTSDDVIVTHVLLIFNDHERLGLDFKVTHRRWICHLCLQLVRSYTRPTNRCRPNFVWHWMTSSDLQNFQYISSAATFIGHILQYLKSTIYSTSTNSAFNVWA